MLEDEHKNGKVAHFVKNMAEVLSVVFAEVYDVGVSWTISVLHSASFNMKLIIVHITRAEGCRKITEVHGAELAVKNEFSR